jgi:ABC-type glycerol-3-phosphate transport system substrate-binding protein
LNNTSRILITLALICGFISGCISEEGPTAPLEATATLTPTAIPTQTLTPTPNVIQGTVTIWHGWDETQRSALFRRIAAFQEIYPDVQFDVLYIPSIDLEDSFKEAMGEDGGPSILLGPAVWGPELYQDGWVIDLSQYASSQYLETLNTAAVDSGRYRQALLSVPLHMDGVVLYRNTSIITSTPDTFDDLVQKAGKATQGGQVGAMLERSFYFSGAHLNGLGGAWMGMNGDPIFNANDYRESLAWLNLLRQFDRAGPPQFQSDGDLKLFKERRLGLLVEDTSQMYVLAGEIDPLNLAIDPWPSYQNGRMSGFIQSEGIFLTPRTLQEDDMISWLFTQFLLSPESQAALASVGYLPVIKPGELASRNLRIGDPFIAQSMAAMSNGTGYPSAPEWRLYETRINLLIQSVIYQGAKTKDALQFTFGNIQTDLANWRAGQTLTPQP